MCGIVGGSGPRSQKRDILACLELLQHRGKDETSFAQCDEHVFLGMNRLSIQDSQPGLYPFKYKQFSLIFNGEIYNLPELTKLLEKKGIHCKTKCDAEVILPLFDLYGVAAFEKLDGMFAIAIYDERKKSFYLARDLFGEKPLYYTQYGKSCFFASELQALPQKNLHINEEAVPEYLAFGFLNQNRTFFKNVYKVLPGECVEIGGDHISRSAFDQISNHLESDFTSHSEENIAFELKKRLQKVAQKKLAGESPIGLFLSGGLDSSLLAALVRKQTKNELFTYSIGFENPRHDESAEAKLVAQSLKTTHTHLVFSNKEVVRIWKQLNKRGDEPFCDPAVLPTFLLAEKAKHDLKVILTGEGADEIFAGYKRYQRFSLMGNFQSQSLSQICLKLPFVGIQLFKIFAQTAACYSPVTYSLLWKYGKDRNLYTQILAKVWQETQERESAFTKLPIPQSLQLHDLRHYVPEQLCMKTDKVLMQHDIESRAPFLDKTLLSFLTISGQKISDNPLGFSNKFWLRKVALQFLPAQIVKKPKHGFSLPIAELLQTSLRKETEKLRNAHPLILKYIDQSSINTLLDEFSRGKTQLKNDIWNLLTLNTWLSQH